MTVAESQREPVAASLGEIIRRQRELAALPMRQLAQMVGISNPYLSQIERGLRRPSAEILSQIAKGLRISVETLYVKAGLMDEPGGAPEVEAAIHGDERLTGRQKQALIEIYRSFCSTED